MTHINKRCTLNTPKNNGGTLKILVDEKRAVEVFSKLVEAFKNKLPPYDTAPLPQILTPTQIQKKSAEHARFLFCCCYYMRGGIRSDTAMKSLAVLYENHPEYFDSAYVAQADEKSLLQSLKQHLQEVKLNYNASVIPQFWIDNFKKINTFWGDNPAQLIQDADYEEITERIMNSGKIKSENPHGFFGFREKMVSMIIYFLVDAEFIDPLHFPVPIDFHALRIITAHEILDTETNTKTNILSPEYLQAARDISVKFCLEHNESPLDLCGALWLLSRTWCSLHPGNASEVGIYHGRKTHIGVSKKSRWTQKNAFTYEATCGRCPIEKTCKYLIPAGYYYRQGKIIIRGERNNHPQLNLFSTK